MSEEESPTRAFVLGLDGVPWDRLRAWADAGELPNFSHLIESGAAGPLESTKPANTALAWPSITTGVWPDKHGVYAFYKLGRNYRHRVNTGKDVAHPALWEMVSPSTVVNVPMTYPASSIDGRMVTGMMTPQKDDGFTHPPELAAEIERRVPDYEIGLDWNEYRNRPAQFPAALESLVEARRTIMGELAEDDWRLFFYVYTAPDRHQHLIWEEDALLSHYKQLDAVLGDAREYAEANDANLFVVSDHGFGPIEKYVHVNRVLANEGYLTPKDDTGTRSTLSQAGLTKERVLGTLQEAGIDTDDLVKRLPESFVNRLAAEIPGENVRYDVDYSETKAFVHAQGTLYINDTERFAEGIVGPNDIESVKDELISVLTAVSDPETGEAVFDVHDGETLFPTDDTAPDLVVEPREGYYVKPSLASDVFTDPGAHAADHRPDGIFLAAGPDIEAGATPEEATVVDVAPTVLHGMGESIPADTDGRVLDEVFSPESPTATRAVSRAEYRSANGVQTTDSEDDFSDVEDRLRGLGYVE